MSITKRAITSLLQDGDTKDIALFTELPNDDGSGGTECTDDWYSRSTCDAWVWSSTARVNNADILFSSVGTTDSVIVGWGIYNGDALIAFGPVTQEDGTVTEVDLSSMSGDDLRFSIGAIRITVEF